MQQAVHRSSSLQVAEGRLQKETVGTRRLSTTYHLRPANRDLVSAGPPLAHLAPGGRTECPACIDEGGCREASLLSFGGCSTGGIGRSDLRSSDAVEDRGESEPRFPRGRSRARARRGRESGSGEGSRRPRIHSG